METVIESFTLDHDSVKAPYVRRIEIMQGPKGDEISSFDVRLVQPNQQEIPTAAMHTLEHLLAVHLRPLLSGYIDCSPYGCRTGFHLFVWGDVSAETAAKAVKQALEQVLEDEWKDVPATTSKECGNYRDHSLFGAHEWARQILDAGMSCDAFERKLV
jgi:S-ribosylhomocysteine lyase